MTQSVETPHLRPSLIPCHGLSSLLLLLCALTAGLFGCLSPVQAGSVPVPHAAASTAATSVVTKEDLEKQKLAEEILQLKNANASHIAFWDRIAGGIPLVTALVAVLGVWATISKMLDDRKQERDQRNAESLRWQAEQQAGRQRQLEESFGAALANLRGDDDAGKAGAVVSLMTFLKPEYATFHDQVYLVLHAMLKLMHPPKGQVLAYSAVGPLFVRAFEQALLALPASSPLRIECDLARMDLRRVRLRGLVLPNADLGYCAMQGADLTGADLFRARGIEVQWEGACLSKAKLGEARLKKAYCAGANFQGAWLGAAMLKEADLRNADFRGASLPSAHLEQAQLAGANFRGADLSDAYFLGASLDEAAIQSIALAKPWEKKATPHFSPEVIPKVENALAAVAGKRAKKAQEKEKKAE
jgi:uncharacterized protein YjbI with pentapeptide repeats